MRRAISVEFDPTHLRGDCRPRLKAKHGKRFRTPRGSPGGPPAPLPERTPEAPSAPCGGAGGRRGGPSGRRGLSPARRGGGAPGCGASGRSRHGPARPRRLGLLIGPPRRRSRASPGGLGLCPLGWGLGGAEGMLPALRSPSKTGSGVVFHRSTRGSCCKNNTFALHLPVAFSRRARALRSERVKENETGQGKHCAEEVSCRKRAALNTA